MNEATTSVEPSAAPSAPAETVSEPTETAGTERSDASAPADDLDSGFDINTVPENIRSDVEKYGKNIERGFKSNYTRKTQDLSARGKALEAQSQAAFRQVEEMKAILADPKRTEAYRQLTQPNEVKPQNFETVDDLINHFEQKTNTLVDQRVAQKLNEVQGQGRWDKAFETLKAKDPELVDLAVSMAISDLKYRPFYTGNNEQQILDMAHHDLQEKLRPTLEKIKNTALTTVAKKQASSTVTPSKTVTTGESRKLTTAEIIARVNAKVPR